MRRNGLQGRSIRSTAGTRPRFDVAVELPTGYFVRHPGSRDSEAIAQVVVAEDIADFGEPDFTEDDLLDDWKRPRFNLGHDAWVLTGPTGRIVGYAYVWEALPGEDIEADAFLLPEYQGRGLGNHLIGVIEDRAAEVAAGREMRLGIFTSRVNEGKRELLERRGFQPVRAALRLKIDLEHRPPEAADPPEGVEVRAYTPADERAVRSMMLDVYSGHGRYTNRRFEEWLELRLEHPAFDPTLWRVALGGDLIVGVVLVYDVGQTGYMSSLAVLPGWRRRGVGPALLRDAFETLRDRGQMRVLVSIDADLAPEMTQVYADAGMRVHEQHDWFEKTVELATDQE
ncbi:MAG: GNAT family N-acetyltransferase [Acidimicrobiia bacterium]|nr:GNAT family N-acetyltransferase [Acidimicrobiia bacterium]